MGAGAGEGTPEKPKAASPQRPVPDLLDELHRRRSAGALLRTPEGYHARIPRATAASISAPAQN